MNHFPHYAGKELVEQGKIAFDAGKTFFENTELKNLLTEESESVLDVYVKTIAEKLAYEKRLIVKELELNGIYSILTSPKQLSVNTINKYLELKSRGLI